MKEKDEKREQQENQCPKMSELEVMLYFFILITWPLWIIPIGLYFLLFNKRDENE